MDDSDSCIFTEVLLPRRSSGSAGENEGSLQFEVHYRDTTKKTLLTFLFNHSRIMLIIDYLLDTYNFIMCRMFKPSAGLQSIVILHIVFLFVIEFGFNALCENNVLPEYETQNIVLYCFAPTRTIPSTKRMKKPKCRVFLS